VPKKPILLFCSDQSSEETNLSKIVFFSELCSLRTTANMWKYADRLFFMSTLYMLSKLTCKHIMVYKEKGKTRRYCNDLNESNCLFVGLLQSISSNGSCFSERLFPKMISRVLMPSKKTFCSVSTNTGSSGSKTTQYFWGTLHHPKGHFFVVFKYYLLFFSLVRGFQCWYTIGIK